MGGRLQKKTTLLRAILAGMTLEQRRHLKIISGLLDDSLDAAMVATLIDLGLVVRVGDTFCATAAGGYVSRLY
jgi:hypothetical protein